MGITIVIMNSTCKDKRNSGNHDANIVNILLYFRIITHVQARPVPFRDRASTRTLRMLKLV